MSSRARLILLSGVGGAGTTTLCSGTVDALREEGRNARLVEAASAAMVDARAVAQLSASLGRAARELGGDPLLPEAWMSLAGVRHLATLARVVDLLDEPEVDAVVVDCGDLQRARELLELPAILLRLLDATMTPRLAMRRSAEPLPAASLFEALSTGRSAVQRMQYALTDPATTMRLVTLARPEAVVRTARAMSMFALMGIHVDGLIANRYPRASEGWAQVHLDRHADALRLLVSEADGVPAWKSTARVRVSPKGTSALGPLGRVRVLDADKLTVLGGDADFSLELPLAGAARAEATVGVVDGHLVVALDDLIRWLPLPPVLQRCVAEYAVRTDEGLRIRFIPDPELWRQPAQDVAS